MVINKSGLPYCVTTNVIKIRIFGSVAHVNLYINPEYRGLHVGLYVYYVITVILGIILQYYHYSSITLFFWVCWWWQWRSKGPAGGAELTGPARVPSGRSSCRNPLARGPNNLFAGARKSLLRYWMVVHSNLINWSSGYLKGSCL